MDCELQNFAVIHHKSKNYVHLESENTIMISKLVLKWATVSSLFLLWTLPCASANSKLLIVKNTYFLHSSDYGYPDNTETLDVIWLFDHSVRLQINKFHLDGHGGDFVLISDLPLLNEEDFLNLNETDDGSYVEDLAKSILTDQGLLLSWKVERTIQAVNERGTFVLFHTEAKDPDATATFEGFEIEVMDHDAEMTTTTSTTPDPVVHPSGPEIYISKFLSCKAPQEFFDDVSDFKTHIARLANEYCEERDITLEDGEITDSEVNIPGPNEGIYAGLHYCDTTWDVYPVCVEVTFSILRIDNVGNFIFNADLLNDMWEEKADDLRPYGYCPYEHPGSLPDLNTLVWIAFFLGVVISISALLMVVWVHNTRSVAGRASVVEGGPTSEIFFQQIGTVDEKDHPPPESHFDPGNPIYSFIPPTTNFSINDNSLLLPGDEGDSDILHGFRRPSFTQNPSFQDAHVDVYAYDNTGFDPETFTGQQDAGKSSNDESGVVLMNRSSMDITDTDI